MARTIREAVVAEFEQVAADQHYKLANLNDDRPLTETGLDSLAFAIVVARLEDSLGIDPFGASEDFQFPVTVGDFIQMYEKTFANATA
jgi:acyl carrier protein